MGIALHPETGQLALASKNGMTVFTDSPELAQHYPPKPGIYDALYMPRMSYHTGPLDLHDLVWHKDRLLAVNTLFSCISTTSDKFNFETVWKPPFISKIAPEDRCHLNGVALVSGEPGYVTCFGNGDTPGSWRDNILKGGVVVDVETGETIAAELPMPHTPRWMDGNLYALLSATGELIRFDLSTGKYDVVTRLDGFVRGMAWHKDYLFIGISRLRKNSSTFAKLELTHKPALAGIAVVHLPTGSLAGKIEYKMSVDEIYDVQVIPDKLRPNILNTTKPEAHLGIALESSTYWAQEKEENNEQESD